MEGQRRKPACRTCRGTGKAKHVAPDGTVTETPCPKCGGTGRRVYLTK